MKKVDSEMAGPMLQPEDSRIFGFDDPFESVLETCFELREAKGVMASVEPHVRTRILQESIQLLKGWSGQDLGDNLDAYANWFGEHRDNWKDYSSESKDPNAYRI